MKFFKSKVEFLAKVYYYSTSLVKRAPGAGAREIDVSIKLHYVFPTAAIVERADTKETKKRSRPRIDSHFSRYDKGLTTRFWK